MSACLQISEISDAPSAYSIAEISEGGEVKKKKEEAEIKCGGCWRRRAGFA